MKTSITLSVGFLMLSVAAAPSGGERFGGYLVRPNSKQGAVLVLNAQDQMKDEEIKAAFKPLFSDGYDVRIERRALAGTAPCELARKSGAPVTVAVFAEKGKPPMVACPDEHWAVVNVAAMDEGLKTDEAKAKFVPGRCRRELLRAFVLAAGASGSAFSGNILSCRKIPDLDLVGEFIPEDAFDSCRKYMATCGITPERRVPYLIAVREGWAPAPTNDVQRMIVEKLQNAKERGPANAIRIQPPKK